jgi:two-component system, LytTR family, sensor kinase
MTLMRGRRPAVVVLVWLAFAVLQAVSLALIGTGDFAAYLAVHGSLALTWAALTFAVGGWMMPHGSDGWGRRILRHGLGLVICALLDTLVRRVVVTLLGSPPVLPWYGTMLYFADRTAVGYLAIVLLSRTIAAHDRFVARRQQSLSLQAQLARARLATLEEQLHPHFLFNCLGAVSELAHEAPAAAARMLRQLASILRFAIEREGSEVTVAEELAALEPYLEVQRTRFSDWLSIELRMEAAARELLMPPLVLQPLVENAIRHGLGRRDRAGAIAITAGVRGDELVLDVRDNGVGLRGSSMSGLGIGTTNVRDRLVELYGDDASLSLFEDDAGGVVSRVVIPVHRRADVSPAAEPEDDTIVTSVFQRWPVASVSLAWAIWGLLWTQQSIAYLAFRGRLGDRSLLDIFAQDFLMTMLWAALTPLMLLMAYYVPIVGRRLPARLAAHATAAIGIAALHEWVAGRLLGTGDASISVESVTATAWGVLAYAVVLVAAHYGQIRAWLRERDLADASMRVRIAEAELEETYARARPLQLLDRLEEIAESIQRDATAAERLLARLGDQLRVSLEEGVPA